jgi:acetylornithine deacetylase/succinyl-diaminopimelate desuccinylase-like protein
MRIARRWVMPVHPATIVAATAMVAFGLMVSPARAASPDWNAVGGEAANLLSRYIQVDTTNPPGNEDKAAQFLKDVLDREGIPAQLYVFTPGRGNVYARLKGDGSRKPMILLNHMDVVPADKRFWSTDPFSGEIKDGYVWGRGALDMKGTGLTYLMAMAMLKRQGIALKRDVVFLGTADEEAGGIHGAAAFVKQQWDLVKDADLVMNEGGAIDIMPNKKHLWSIDTAEKTPVRVTMTATGIPGHGSMPKENSAVIQLIDALEKLAHYQTPFKVLPEVQEYYATISETVDASRREAMRNLAETLKNPEAAKGFLNFPANNARVRNTLSITMLEGSNKINVIPPEASAQFDVRLLPGENADDFVAELRRVIQNDSIKFSYFNTPSAGSSSAKHPLFDAARAVAKELDPDSVVAPSMLVAATDCRWFRPKGIPCYGFVPFIVPDKEWGGVHGNNERVSVSALTFGVHAMYELLLKLAAE